MAEVINWRAEELRSNFVPDGTQSGMKKGTIDVIVQRNETPKIVGSVITGIGGASYAVKSIVEQREAKGHYPTKHTRPTFQRLQVEYTS